MDNLFEIWKIEKSKAIINHTYLNNFDQYCKAISLQTNSFIKYISHESLIKDSHGYKESVVKQPKRQLFRKRDLPLEEHWSAELKGDERMSFCTTLENAISSFNQIATKRSLISDNILGQGLRSSKSFFIDEPKQKYRKIKAEIHKGVNSKCIKNMLSDQSLAAVSTTHVSTNSKESSQIIKPSDETATSDSCLLPLSKDCTIDKANSAHKLNLCHKQSSSSNSCKSCLSCGWRFPKIISLQEINYHINQCIDGFGERNKAYLNYKHDLPNSSSAPSRSKKQ